MALINDEQSQPMEELPPEAEPRGVRRGRRTLVVILGALLAAAAVIMLAVTFVRGSGWHFYATDRPLDADARARLETVRDEVDASSKAPDAVRWLNAALAPDTDATAVRLYLMDALEALEATDDASLAGAAQELQAIILEIRPGPTTWPLSTVTP